MVRSNIGTLRDLRLGDVPGQVACAVADFNGDGSLDLAVALTDGRVRCFYNDSFNKPLLRVGLVAGGLARSR